MILPVTSKCLYQIIRTYPKVDASKINNFLQNRQTHVTSGRRVGVGGPDQFGHSENIGANVYDIEKEKEAVKKNEMRVEALTNLYGYQEPTISEDIVEDETTIERRIRDKEINANLLN